MTYFNQSLGILYDREYNEILPPLDHPHFVLPTEDDDDQEFSSDLDELYLDKISSQSSGYCSDASGFSSVSKYTREHDFWDSDPSDF